MLPGNREFARYILDKNTIMAIMSLLLTRLFSEHWLEFLLAMTEKEIKARYKHALLGFLWIILNPLLQMLVIGFVFQFFVPVRVDNYFLFLFTGLLPWNFFSLSFTKATPAFVHERSLIQKAKFPRESIVLSIVLSHLFHFLVALTLLFLMLLGQFFLKATPTEVVLGIQNGFLKVIIFFAALVWLGIFTAGISLLGATLNVRFRDVSFAVNALIPLWSFATPIIYTLNLLPPFLQPLAYLNPMTGIVELFRWILLDIPITFNHGIWLSLSLSILIALLGWVVFYRENPYFDDWI